MNTFISSRDTSTAATDVSSGGRILWIIVSICSIIGAAVILTLAFVGHAILRRRRKVAFREFEAARLRDPTLTWEVYARRRRFTHSRLLFEQELQRSIIIRKSQQSRTSIVTKRVGVGQEVDSKRSEGEEGEILLKTRRSDDSPLDFMIMDKRQDLATESRSPLPTRDIQHIEDNSRRDYPCLANIRLKTPPLLAHPAFRGYDRPYPPRSSSLPTELTRTKPFPLP
ncbi:uncharacterized protein F4807DRAFT_471169 [Annulohypoxylon truncatum]|uniref:uncharacterized protein n=1 Tax=Annulohypoxylon truncatum TaxID=327061 RepID=UPI0020072B75|nr:uncharacterized protein F4807DRAFT_471169 [Annulohypoxylon truncatum]KAI1205325.1 hypothetical protein F4807DRAFT_471169 [Annulohypoxylon truncatum]